MKTFGKKFKTYRPFQIENLALPKKQISELKTLGATAPFKAKMSIPSKAISKEDRLNKIKKELAKTVVALAPTANVYQISPDQPDLAKTIKNTMADFDYYVVELGLNVMLGRQFKIPELLLKLELDNNLKKTNAVAYDLAPNNKLKNIKIAGGKITLGVNKLLQLIPSPVGKLAANLINIEINPWEFEWNIKKCLIDACGRKNYRVYWKIYQTDTAQSFNPTMILKVKKNVKKVSASVKCVYKLKTGWWDFAPAIKTDTKEIKIF